MIAELAPPCPAFDWGIIEVLGLRKHPDIQRVFLVCGCVGVWAPVVDGDPAPALVGYARLCYAHESFKLLARVWQSQN